MCMQSELRIRRIDRKMKKVIVYQLLITLISIVIFPSFAQQNQNTSQQEIEALKKQLSEIQSKLQTVENVEKMELAAKLAEANAKLANAEFSKFERELRESNNKWLWGWTGFFVGIVAIVITVIGLALWYYVKTLIADRVEERLNGFKEVIEQVDILKDQLRLLRKEQAASMLEATFQPDFGSELGFPRENEARREKALLDLSEEALLDVFDDKKYLLAVRHKAAEVLAQKSPSLVEPLLQLLNSAIDLDSNATAEIGRRSLRNSISVLSGVETPETYEGLTKFLNRLLTENPEHKDAYLTWTVFSLAYVGIKLNKSESASILRRTIPYLDVRSDEDQALKNLARLFDIFNEPTGIKEILTYHAAGKMTEVEDKCLELLEKHDPDFVKEWKAQKATTNTENEESS